METDHLEDQDNDEIIIWKLMLRKFVTVICDNSGYSLAVSFCGDDSETSGSQWDICSRHKR
jgi:hypothetical protein